MSAAVAAILALVLAALLGFAVLSMPPSEGLASAVHASLPAAGVENPVTAVLLGLRAYDTLLELAVLFLALLGVRAAALAEPDRRDPPGGVLRVLTELLVPFLVVFAAYLLWAGSSEPGGAFQAGAVIAAAGVLLALSGMPPPPVPGVVSRVAAAAGLATFIAVGVGTLAVGGHLLEYRGGAAKGLILLIESAASVSIGLALLGVFRGGRARPDARSTPP